VTTMRTSAAGADSPPALELPRIQTLLLDLDGTLLDWSQLRKAIRSTCAGITAEYPHLELDALEIEKVNDAVWDSYWPEVELDWYRGELDNDELGLEAWRRTFEHFGLHEAELVQATTDAWHRAERDGHRLFDDVTETLEAARDAGIRLAIVTNGPSGAQRAKLEALGIDDSFDAVFISAEVGAAKPDPAIFDFAIEELDADPATTWHVGDLLDKDVAGAQAAGIRGVWLNRLGETAADGDAVPDLEITSLRELLPALDVGGAS
jgi:putative hydrolase of the HAD superfamily